VTTHFPARWRQPAFAAAIVLTALVTLLAACGSSGSNSAAAAPAVSSPAAAPASAASAGTSMPGMEMPTGAATSADGPAVSANAIAIKNFAFSPAKVTVKVGTTITWTNQDSDAHTVTSMNGGPLRSKTLNTGDTYQYTFTTAGTYSYLCTIHPFMLGSVVVTA
jgi:plastocyanin